MQAKELKAKLNIENYRQIFTALGAEWKETNNEYWLLRTGCHNKDWQDGSYKLYFYLNTKSFFCFTECQCSMDIIELVKKRWDLEGRQYEFKNIIEWICGVIGLSERFNLNDNVINHQSWKSRLERYITPQNHTYIGKTYDKRVLKLLKPHYHKSFLDDGITIETMKRFGIGFYFPQNQITIPVFTEDGRLAGIHCRNLNQKVIDKGYKYLPLRLSNGDMFNFKTNQVLYGFNYNKPMIEKTKRAILFEAPKSVLQMDSYFGRTNCVALFGMNLNITRRNLLLKCDIKEIVIALDKQYRIKGDNEWEKWCKNILKIAKLFNGYCKVTVIVDENNLLDYKDSPSDKGKEVWCELFKNRREIKT